MVYSLSGVLSDERLKLLYTYTQLQVFELQADAYKSVNLMFTFFQ